ncbi:MAG: hypothetical protein ABL891_08835, partial [Burkholderiales bacterium]
MRAVGAVRAGRWYRGTVAIFLLAAFGLATTGRTQQITLTLDDLTSPAFSAQAIKMAFTGGGVTALDIGTMTIGTQSWKNIRLDCKALKLEGTRIACDN